MEQKLKGRVALVTGAARGIGQAHALRLARLGADVAVNDINLESFKEFDETIDADSIEELIGRQGVTCRGYEANVCHEEDAKGMVEEVIRDFGRIDILINNAGGIAGKPVDSFASSVSLEDLTATIDRNLMGTIFYSQAASPHMKAQRWGRIVNTSSQAGLRSQGWGVYASYGVAKAGVIAYTKYLAQELGEHNITVNCLAPAYVATERLMRQSFNRVEDVRRELRVPLGRLALPEDVSKVVELFVTDLGDYITGQTISICGGAINF